MGDARNEHAGPAEEAAVREPRTSRLLRGEISSSRFGTARIVVRNISAGGLGGQCDQVLLKGEKVAVLLNTIDPVEATNVRSQGKTFDVQFNPKLYPYEPVAHVIHRKTVPYEDPPHFRPSPPTARQVLSRKNNG